MKKLLLSLFVAYSFTTYAQNVGIGTASPQARLHVSDSSVLFSGPPGVSANTLFGPPASGSGVRFMWYPQKAAIRAGFSYMSGWEKDDIGLYTVAMGRGVIAKGESSVSLGENNQAYGDRSFAGGYATATFGRFSASFGYLTEAWGEGAFANGYMTRANGDYSLSNGYLTRARANNSSTFGLQTATNVANQMAIGQFNDTSNTTCVFAIGNGTSGISRSNAFSVLLNGSAGIGVSSPALFSGFPGLHVRNNGYTQLHLESLGTSSGIEFNPGGTGRSYEIQADVHSNFFVYDRGLNVYRLVLNSSGNLGIGNTSPDAPLSFVATGGEKIALLPLNASQRHGIGIFQTAFYSAMRFYVPAQADFVSWGTGSNSSFTENMSLEGNGVLRVRTSVIAPYAFAPSDLRFKQGLQPIADPLKKISYLNGYTYHYRTEGFPEKHFSDREQVGVVAQEVEAVMPQAVSTDADGYKSVDYSKLVPLLIEGMKAQQEQLRTQNERMELLLKRIEVLEKKQPR